MDTIAIGQDGPAGAAAMAVITLLCEIFAFLSILCGVGGAVCYSAAKGDGNRDKANAFFTTATAFMILVALLLRVIFALFHLLWRRYGADAEAHGVCTVADRLYADVSFLHVSVVIFPGLHRP